MALKQLNEEQIRDWTLEQKDRWWFENVWKGDMPQLTIRSAMTGMLLGGVLSLTNLYIGAKTGWSLGVGITSVILAFSLFKVLSSLKLSSEFSILENNCMQSIATAAGYMTAPMISSLAAYMMITDTVIPIHHTIIWITSLALLGVLFAFPLKRRFINDEQHPFPEGRAAGVVMYSLHTSDAKEGIVKGSLLAISGGFAAIVTLGTEGASILKAISLKFLTLPHTLDGWIYNFFSPKINGLDPRQLGIGVVPDVAMFGAGGLMGIKIGTSLILGAVVNYFILAPCMIHYENKYPGEGIAQLKNDKIEKKVFMEEETGKKVVKNDVGAFIYENSYKSPKDLERESKEIAKNPDILKEKKKKDFGKKVEKPVTGTMVHMYDFKAITKWALWPGVAIMTAASLFAFFSKPQVLISSFKGLFSRKKGSSETGISDEMKKVELPMRVFCIGIPIMGTIVVLLANYIFGVKYWHGAIAIPLIFFFTLIAVNSTALTGITPTGALGKLTQLTFAGIAPGKINTNIATAAITGEVAGHASNLLMDIKPGYMLGAKPRQQAIGHALGIIAGSLFAVPVFYYVFLKGDPSGLVTSEYPMPAAMIWKSVAELLTKGLDQLAQSIQLSILVGIGIGLACEILKLLTKGRFWLSGVGLGLSLVISFQASLAMFSGAFFFWILGIIWKNPDAWISRIVVKNTEAICAGLIAGGALMGILVKVITTFLL